MRAWRLNEYGGNRRRFYKFVHQLTAMPYKLKELEEMQKGITPGEWAFDPKAPKVPDSKSWVYSSGGLICASVMQEDADLIAAAPALLAQLIETMREKEKSCKHLIAFKAGRKAGIEEAITTAINTGEAGEKNTIRIVRAIRLLLNK